MTGNKVYEVKVAYMQNMSSMMFHISKPFSSKID